MNNLMIIDDSACRQELDQFVKANAHHIKLLLTEEEYNVDLETLIHRIQDIFNHQKIIFVKTEDSVIKVTSNDILYIEESNNTLKLHLKSGTVYNLTDKLSHYTKMLSRFNILPINGHILINASLIESFIISEGILFCSDGSKFIVEEQYKTSLITELNKIYT